MSRFDTHHDMILLRYSKTYNKQLTKTVLLIKMLTLILHCGLNWTGLDLVLVTQGQRWHQNKKNYDSEAENPELFYTNMLDIGHW